MNNKNFDNIINSQKLFMYTNDDSRIRKQYTSNHIKYWRKKQKKTKSSIKVCSQNFKAKKFIHKGSLWLSHCKKCLKLMILNFSLTNHDERLYTLVNDGDLRYGV